MERAWANDGEGGKGDDVFPGHACGMAPQAGKGMNACQHVDRAQAR